MDFTKILAFLTTPAGAVLLEGIGKGIVTVAEHNKEHLGKAEAPIAAVGAALEGGASPGSAAEVGVVEALA